MNARPLRDDDRRFFAQVARAAFANPFGTEREQLDLSLAETDASDPWILERLAQRLRARLGSLSVSGAVRIDAYRGDDRELLFAAVLFHVFHRYLAKLDALIEREEREASPPTVEFARELLAELAEHGFAADEGRRLFELFFQIRRGHLAVQRRLTGTGPSMRRVREELWNAAFTRDIRRYERYLWSRMEDFSTLLVGETGTGKGEAARALGYSAFIAFDDKRCAFRERAADLFVPIHLSEFPESLLESELFGHKKGAFTGAVAPHVGALGRVKPHGIVFLDEIGEISLPAQVKLLRVLQDREFTPVGGHEPERFTGRVVAATHRSFASLRADGRMRDDFFYRLCTNTIALPSLRARLDESPGELGHLVERLVTRIVGEPSPELSDEVHAAVLRDLGPDHPFPGNVRELEQCVRRVMLSGSCAHGEPARPTGPALDTLLGDTNLSAETLLARYCAALHARHGSFVEVARITGLDRRTVKKHVEEASRARSVT